MKKTVSLLIVFILVFSNCHAAVIGNETITSHGAVAVDYRTGQIMYGFNENEAFAPASMTKIMTTYIVFDALKNGEIMLSTRVPISKKAYDLSRDWYNGGGEVLLNYDEIYYVDEMIDAMLVNSHNASAVALAELIEGSEENFVKRMDAKLNEIGIDAKFYCSSGLSNDSTITPYNMALLARRIIMDYPEILERTSKKEVNFHRYKLKSSNKLLTEYYYEGIDGLKTGTTQKAGSCLCATGIKNGRRLITVTMKSKDDEARFSDSKKLLDYGFEKYKYVKSTDIKTYIKGAEVPTFMYDAEKTYAAVIAEDLSCYGFDVSYDNDTRTLLIRKNNEKVINPISMAYYDSFANGVNMYSINHNSDIKIRIVAENVDYYMNDVLNLNGYMAISTDELANIFGGIWSGEKRAIVIDWKLF